MQEVNENLRAERGRYNHVTRGQPWIGVGKPGGLKGLEWLVRGQPDVPGTVDRFRGSGPFHLKGICRVN
ncbi:hypothetical protein DPMN_173884 [Dreissena polymorpha]|uniref:Uncharacterized protein n=1 Tax=Dreissena polymorpha TaxID=45954 RepID=A0A9D4E4B0_DREPO|nr:hypothetical protein DPMN_173884 [Dreissena polymorpha]